jgi:hypothetical protein
MIPDPRLLKPLSQPHLGYRVNAWMTHAAVNILTTIGHKQPALQQIGQPTTLEPESQAFPIVAHRFFTHPFYWGLGFSRFKEIRFVLLGAHTI